MKKFFTLIAAALTAVTMSAQTEITFASATSSEGTFGSGDFTIKTEGWSGAVNNTSNRYFAADDASKDAATSVTGYIRPGAYVLGTVVNASKYMTINSAYRGTVSLYICSSNATERKVTVGKSTKTTANLGTNASSKTVYQILTFDITDDITNVYIDGDAYLYKVTFTSNNITSCQTIFSLSRLTNTAKVNVAAGGDLDLSTYSTITGGSALIHNGKTSEQSMLQVTNSRPAMVVSAGGACNIKITLASGKTFSTGDIVTLVNRNFGYDGATVGGSVILSGSGSADNVTAVTGINSAKAAEIIEQFVMPASFDGQSSILITKGGDNKPFFSDVFITHDASKIPQPTYSCKNGVLTISSSVDGASIYYSTTTGVTPSTGTLYTAPISVSETTTYYFVAAKDGMVTSDEVSVKVVKASGYLAATFRPTADPTSDTAVGTATVNEFSLALTSSEGTTFVTTAPYPSATEPTFALLYKVKGSLQLTVPTGKKVTAVKVYGIANSTTESTLTMEGFEATTGTNILPSRDNAAKEMGCIEFALAGDEVASPILACPSQSRLYMEVYTDTPSAINEVSATPAKSANGIVKTADYIIKNGKKYNYAGQQVK